eukprot:GILJ01006730.1.p1 GENE.GILJ01006730.1~~GILJ01006730.1.p1  ORF type:complete len:524 (-),score=101.36 GILJ01006730.1:310-1881(-)
MMDSTSLANIEDRRYNTDNNNNDNNSNNNNPNYRPTDNLVHILTTYRETHQTLDPLTTLTTVRDALKSFWKIKQKERIIKRHGSVIDTQALDHLLKEGSQVVCHGHTALLLEIAQTVGELMLLDSMPSVNLFLETLQKEVQNRYSVMTPEQLVMLIKLLSPSTALHKTAMKHMLNHLSDQTISANLWVRVLTQYKWIPQEIEQRMVFERLFSVCLQRLNEMNHKSLYAVLRTSYVAKSSKDTVIRILNRLTPDEAVLRPSYVPFYLRQLIVKGVDEQRRFIKLFNERVESGVQVEVESIPPIIAAIAETSARDESILESVPNLVSTLLSRFIEHVEVNYESLRLVDSVLRVLAEARIYDKNFLQRISDRLGHLAPERKPWERQLYLLYMDIFESMRTFQTPFPAPDTLKHLLPNMETDSITGVFAVYVSAVKTDATITRQWRVYESVFEVELRSRFNANTLSVECLRLMEYWTFQIRRYDDEKRSEYMVSEKFRFMLRDMKAKLAAVRIQNRLKHTTSSAVEV